MIQVDQTLDSEKTPHSSPSQVSYGMSIVNIYKNIRKNIYRSDVQVTLKLYGHFRCLQVLYFK